MIARRLAFAGVLSIVLCSTVVLESDGDGEVRVKEDSFTKATFGQVAPSVLEKWDGATCSKGLSLLGLKSGRSSAGYGE